jgi:hypothetical protein
MQWVGCSGPIHTLVTTMEDLNLTPRPSVYRIAGLAALASGLAWIFWVAINLSTGGGLDTGMASPNLVTAGKFLMVAQNLLLIPTAIVLNDWMNRQNSEMSSIYTICGIVGMVFWSYTSASGTNNLVVEASYLCLFGIWWLGIGLTIRCDRRLFGWFSIIVASFAFWDSIVTATGAPFWLFVTAAPKLPLSWIWDFVVAGMLLSRKPTKKVLSQEI